MHAAQNRALRPVPRETAPPSVTDQVRANGHVVAAAANGPLQDAIESVPWKRSGLLKRLQKAA
jgi:hypothetical protein